MEVLNNIWMAISTPNVGLANFIVSIGIFLEHFLFMNIFIVVLDLSATKKQKLIYVLIMSFISILTMYTIVSPFNILLNYLIMIGLVYIIFGNSFLKTSICVVISGIIFNIIGALVLNPFLRISQITTTDLYETPIYRFAYITLIYTIISIIYFLLKNRNIRISFVDTIDKNTKLIIIANILLGVLSIVTQSIMLFYYVDTMPILITFFNFIMVLTYFGISIYSLSKTFKLVLTTRKLESAEAYNDTLHILHDNVRGFKHDFDNIVTTIGGYIRTNDINGLKDYYLQLEDDCQRVNNLYILNPDIINNDGVYNLLTKKYNDADSKDIKVTITVLLDLSTLKMKIYEFARMLGILLDNAIEASAECEEKNINIIFRNDTRNKRQLVIVENTYSNKDVDTEKIFEKGVSEKENHTGLGLWEVRKIINKNKNTNLHTSKTEHLFSQQLEIY